MPSSWRPTRPRWPGASPVRSPTGRRAGRARCSRRPRSEATAFRCTLQVSNIPLLSPGCGPTGETPSSPVDGGRRWGRVQTGTLRESVVALEEQERVRPSTPGPAAPKTATPGHGEGEGLVLDSGGESRGEGLAHEHRAERPPRIATTGVGFRLEHQEKRERRVAGEPLDLAGAEAGVGQPGRPPPPATPPRPAQNTPRTGAAPPGRPGDQRSLEPALRAYRPPDHAGRDYLRCPPRRPRRRPRTVAPHAARSPGRAAAPGIRCRRTAKSRRASPRSAASRAAVRTRSAAGGCAARRRRAGR